MDAAHFLGAALDFVFLRMSHRPFGDDGQGEGVVFRIAFLFCVAVLGGSCFDSAVKDCSVRLLMR